MNICMVLMDRYFPPDIRVEKEARALLSAGHKIILLSLGREGASLVEDVHGIQVIRILLPKNILSRLSRFIPFSLFFVDSFWKTIFEDIVKHYKIDMFHVHDLPIVKTAQIVAKKYGISIIADLHENYPEALKATKSYSSLYTKIFEFLLSPSRFSRMAKSILPQIDHIIAVIDEGKEFYSREYDIPKNKISVIMNTEDLQYYDAISIQNNLLVKWQNNFVVSYIGGFGPHRGIDTAIKATPAIIESIPHAKLILVGGKGSSSFEQSMQDLCKQLGVEEDVEFTGWVDFQQVPTYVTVSSVCLIPHLASGHTNSTIPHKLFQYMAMKKPIVTTDCIPLKRIVEETRCGVVVPSGDARAMAEAVIRIYHNPNLAYQYGENGRIAVDTKYNWKNESEKLIRLYERLSE